MICMEKMTQRKILKEVDYFYDVRYMSDADVVLLAKNKGIDIAVDLKGFTLQSRLGIFHTNSLQFKSVILGTWYFRRKIYRLYDCR